MRARIHTLDPAAMVVGIGLGLTMALGLAAAAGPAPELRKVHALLVVDTMSSLAESVKVDGERMERLLYNNLPADRSEIRVLTGKDVSAEGILAYYRTLKVTPNDALLFYYAGHGATDPEKGQFLALHELKAKPLIRGDLRRAMEQNRPGLIVIITDCCSDRHPLPGKMRRIYEEEGRARAIQPVLRCLLYQSRGVVDITASSGNAAFGDDHEGGIFTRSIDKLVRGGIENLDADRDGFVSWPEFFARVQKETQGTFVTWANRQRALGEDVDQKSQKPRAFSLGSIGGAVPVRLRNDHNTPVDYQYRWVGHPSWESGRLAPHGIAEHAPPADGTARPTALEVRYEGGKTAQLQPGKTYRFHDAKTPRNSHDPSEGSSAPH